MSLNINAPYSVTAVGNMAIDVLDDVHVTSLTEDSPTARYLASNFGFVRDELLQSHPWVFAKTRKLVSALPDAPEFDWKYQYELPVDCLRPLPLRFSGTYNASQQPRFEREGRRILTNEAGPLKLQYIRRVTNASEFTPLFARALAYRLALGMAHSVTGKGQYVDKARGLYLEALAEAIHVNALEFGTPEDLERPTLDVLEVRTQW